MNDLIEEVKKVKADPERRLAAFQCAGEA